MSRSADPLTLPMRLELIVEILWTYCRVRWMLRRGEVRNVVGRLRGSGPAHAGPTSIDEQRAARRLGYAVGRVLALLPTDSRCLMRSLVLIHLLARRGVRSSLILAVSPAPGFAAHAWVEHNGLALLPTFDRRFERLVEL